MVKHLTSSHREDRERPQFGMRVVRYHTSALHRQIHEACLIWQRARQGDVMALTSKSMGRGSLKRLVVEDSNSEAQNDDFRRDRDGDQRQDGESSAGGPSNSNNSANNTFMGKTGSRKRKQTDGQTADIRSFMKKVTDRDKHEE